MVFARFKGDRDRSIKDKESSGSTNLTRIRPQFITGHIPIGIDFKQTDRDPDSKYARASGDQISQSLPHIVFEIGIPSGVVITSKVILVSIRLVIQQGLRTWVGSILSTK